MYYENITYFTNMYIIGYTVNENIFLQRSRLFSLCPHLRMTGL